MTILDPVQVFRTQPAELLGHIKSGLLDLLHYLFNQDQIDAVFRGLPTLKGSAAMFDLEVLAAFTHHCETAVNNVRKGEVPTPTEIVSAVLESQKHIRRLVESPAAALPETGNRLPAKLQSAVGEGAAPQSPPNRSLP